jgi:hypothetical protein
MALSPQKSESIQRPSPAAQERKQRSSPGGVPWAYQEPEPDTFALQDGMPSVSLPPALVFSKMV